MELLKGGHLKRLMSKYKQEGKWFTEFEISLLMKTLLRAIDYIHYKNIVHRDIKPGFFSQYFLFFRNDKNRLILI